MNPVQHLLIALLRAYRWLVSPLLLALFSPQGICRYTPSCSEYAIEAVRTHGAWRGARLAAQRLLRCHPWGDGGHDPVPQAARRVDAPLSTCCPRARS